MISFSLNLVAKIGAGLLLFLVLRALGEVFRAEYTRTDALAYADVRHYVIAAFVAALSLGLTLLAIQFGRARTAIVLACLTAAGLFLYWLYWLTLTS